MSQQYNQKFEYRSAAKSEFDQAWTVALQTFAKSGNWGGVEKGVRHLKTFGTAWGGYVEPVYDLDAALAGRART